jgi:hypothetical protein
VWGRGCGGQTCLGLLAAGGPTAGVQSVPNSLLYIQVCKGHESAGVSFVISLNVDAGPGWSYPSLASVGQRVWWADLPGLVGGWWAYCRYGQHLVSVFHAFMLMKFCFA